jgi:hypothetical protein
LSCVKNLKFEDWVRFLGSLPSIPNFRENLKTEKGFANDIHHPRFLVVVHKAKRDPPILVSQAKMHFFLPDNILLLGCSF